MRRVFFGVAATVASVELFLLLANARILVRERRVSPGEHVVVEGYGNLSEGAQDSLVCTYFDGRALRDKVYWYSPSNTLGRDACPFLAFSPSQS